jgi:hypothetical protein
MLDYEPLLERDKTGIRSAVRSFRAHHTAEDLFASVARFAVLAYSPAQHARHAMLACLAAFDLRDDCGSAWDDVLIECAIYAAESRQPWSEPPLSDPPALEPDSPIGVAELRAAVAAGDRLRAERWLAASLDGMSLAAELFAVATDDFEDFGHKLIVANAAWRLAAILGERGRFAVLRTAVWEMCAYRGSAPQTIAQVPEALADLLVESALLERGSTESMHRVFLYDAAMQCGVLDRVAGFLAASVAGQPDRGRRGSDRFTSPRAYPLARDYAALLQAFVVAKRLGDARVILAAELNLQSGNSFADWTFA